MASLTYMHNRVCKPYHYIGHFITGENPLLVTYHLNAKQLKPRMYKYCPKSHTIHQVTTMLALGQ